MNGAQGLIFIKFPNIIAQAKLRLDQIIKTENFMKYQKIGNASLEVSKICLGTMTFGEQTAEDEALKQLDYAFDHGVNFIDTAEMYPVPANPDTQGETERIIGKWLEKNNKRKEVYLATKIVGPGYDHIRGVSRFNAEHIKLAIEGSFERLKTDYFDLYQLHWPERKANFFGKINYSHDPNDPWVENFLEVLELLNQLKKEGKIRDFGVSNETPWGLMKYLQEAKNNDLLKCQTIQNPYSLVNRSFEVGLTEVCMRENVGLLAYSPLAFGSLSGKYLNGAKPDNSRLTLFPQFRRFLNDNAMKATAKYQELADKSGMSLVHLALAFVNMQPFVTSNIIGARTLEQLKENIASIDVKLSADILAEIEKINTEFPNPAP